MSNSIHYLNVGYKTAPKLPINEKWETFISTTHNFIIKHPSDLEIKHDIQGGVIFCKFGSSQLVGGEITDGLYLIFNSGLIGNKPIQTLVKEKKEEKKQKYGQEHIGHILPTKLGGSKGYKFYINSWQEIFYLYLTKNNYEYLEIANLTNDLKNRGYKKTVEQILSTLQINYD